MMCRLVICGLLLVVFTMAKPPPPQDYGWLSHLFQGQTVFDPKSALPWLQFDGSF
jgi:hypothetical protein